MANAARATALAAWIADNAQTPPLIMLQHQGKLTRRSSCIQSAWQACATSASIVVPLWLDGTLSAVQLPCGASAGYSVHRPTLLRVPLAHGKLGRYCKSTEKCFGFNLLFRRKPRILSTNETWQVVQLDCSRASTKLFLLRHGSKCVLQRQLHASVGKYLSLAVCEVCQWGVQKVGEKRGRQERIDCLCGVTADTPAAEQYPGLWLQCDDCLSWLHGACVGYPKRAPKGAPPVARFLVLSCTLSSLCHTLG